MGVEANARTARRLRVGLGGDQRMRRRPVGSNLFSDGTARRGDALGPARGIASAAPIAEGFFIRRRLILTDAVAQRRPLTPLPMNLAACFLRSRCSAASRSATASAPTQVPTAPPALGPRAPCPRGGPSSAGSRKNLRFARGRDSIAARAPPLDLNAETWRRRTRRANTPEHGPRRSGPTLRHGSATILESEAQRITTARWETVRSSRDDRVQHKHVVSRAGYFIRRKRALPARRSSCFTNGRPILSARSWCPARRPPALVEHRSTYTSAARSPTGSRPTAMRDCHRPFHFGRARRAPQRPAEAYDSASSMPTR